MNTKKNKDLIQLSITLPKEVIDKIDLLASAEERSRSNYLSILLKKVLAEMEVKDESKQ